VTSTAIVKQLKKELKARAVTYAELGRRLKLSEAAVKRQFAKEDFTLRRLDRVCGAVGIDLFELTQSASKRNNQVLSLPPDTERKLAKYPRLLLCLYGVMQGYSVQRIRKLLNASDSDCFLLFRKLEREGLVEIHPGNRIRCLVAIDVRWQPTGPLATMYSSSIRDEFFSSGFHGDSEFQDFLTRRLSKSDFETFRDKLRNLFRDMNELSERTSTSDESEDVFWFYAGIRPWAPVKAIQRAASARTE
jgi:hypothetical protein